MNIKTAQQVFDENAAFYESKFMHFDLYDDTYKALLKKLKAGAHVLEIGCGPGNITRYLLDKGPGLKILATDFAPEMVKIAAKNCPEAQFKIMDCRDILELDTLFDAVVIGFCLPYLTRNETQKLISDCARLLHKDGIVYVSAINGNYEDSKIQMSSDGKLGTMVYIYQESDLKQIFDDNNLVQTDSFRKEFPTKNNTPDTHLILMAKKQ